MTVPNQGQFRAGALTRHVQEWSQITDDYITLQAIKGVKLPLIGRPPVRCPSRAELDEWRVDPVIDETIKELLYLNAVQEVHEKDEVFLSRIFTVPKMERGKEYARRFIQILKVSSLYSVWI